jgi:hypothetical protein
LLAGVDVENPVCGSKLGDIHLVAPAAPGQTSRPSGVISSHWRGIRRITSNSKGRRTATGLDSARHRSGLQRMAHD